MKKIEAALFDLDGTLMDSEMYYTRFWKEISIHMLPDVPDLWAKARGVSAEVTYARFFPDEKKREEVRNLMKIWDNNLECRMFPGAMEFVSDLRRHGIKCAVVTSSSTTKMQLIYRRVPGFRESFDLILPAEELERPKPAPDCYLKAARMLGVPADRCIVFEDAFSGFASAKAAGIFTVGMATSSSHEEIEGCCDHVLDSFEGMNYRTLCSLLGIPSD